MFDFYGRAIISKILNCLSKTHPIYFFVLLCKKLPWRWSKAINWYFQIVTVSFLIKIVSMFGCWQLRNAVRWNSWCLNQSLMISICVICVLFYFSREPRELSSCHKKGISFHQKRRERDKRNLLKFKGTQFFYSFFCLWRFDRNLP